MKDVTRSTTATGDRPAAIVEGRRRALPNGMWGVALLVATEAALFGTLLATYYYLRFQTTQWPPAGVEDPKVTLPLVLTGVLVLTTVPMFLAARSVRNGLRRPALGLIAFAVLLQAGYLAVQIILYKGDLDRFSPRDTAYGSIYFTMLAADHVHVLLGIVLNLAIVVRLSTGLTNYRLIAVRVAAFYWYFVAAVTVLVVLTQLSPAL